VIGLLVARVAGGPADKERPSQTAAQALPALSAEAFGVAFLAALSSFVTAVRICSSSQFI